MEYWDVAACRRSQFSNTPILHYSRLNGWSFAVDTTISGYPSLAYHFGHGGLVPRGSFSFREGGAVA